MTAHSTVAVVGLQSRKNLWNSSPLIHRFLFEGFRQRDISGLAPLTDSQIEEGIREVDSRYPGDDLVFTCNRDVIVAVA